MTSLVRLVTPCLVFALGCGRIGFAERAADDAATAPCPAALLGAYPMETTDLDGLTVYDRSGNGHDGTVVGSPVPTTVPGHIGDALAYAATGTAYVAVPGLPLDAAPGAAITVSLWFFREDTNVDDALVYAPASPKFDVWLTRDPRCPGLCLCLNTASGDCWGLLDSGLVDRWVHLAAILRNGPVTNSELFVDGQPQTLTCVFGTCDTSRTLQGPFELGGSDGYNWHGLVDDVLVHARALSAAEIADVYRGACAL